jgi:tetratricopeptide (TPR) repeat protein
MSKRASLTAVFVIGVACLIAIVAIAILIPEPSPFAQQVFKVLLALAAAGVGAFLPGTFGYESKLAKGTGATGLFVLVFVTDPSGIPRERAFETALQQAEAALATSGFNRIAEQKFREAMKVKPDSALPYSGLARTYFRDGKFTSAVENFAKAFELSGSKDPSYLYSKANSELALNRFDDAAKTFELAIKLSGSIRDSELAKVLAYDFAATRFAQWRSSALAADSPHYQEAVKNFTLFIENGGFPRQWAHYNLACLKAMNSANRPRLDPQVKMLRADAATDLRTAVHEISIFRGETRPYHVGLIRTILTRPDGYREQRGDPPGCPLLVEVWTADKGPVAQLLSVLNE